MLSFSPVAGGNPTREDETTNFNRSKFEVMLNKIIFVLFVLDADGAQFTNTFVKAAIGQLISFVKCDS